MGMIDPVGCTSPITANVFCKVNAGVLRLSADLRGQIDRVHVLVQLLDPVLLDRDQLAMLEHRKSEREPGGEDDRVNVGDDGAIVKDDPRGGHLLYVRLHLDKCWLLWN